MRAKLATTPEELRQVFTFRYQVFVAEQGKQIRHADHARCELIDDVDSDATQLVVLDDNNAVVGAIRTVFGRDRATTGMQKNYSLDRFGHWKSENCSFTGRLFVVPEKRGSRALLILIHELYRLGRARGAIFDFIFCAPYLVRLYEQLGYRRYRANYEDPDLGFQIPMVLVGDDVAHLAGVRSPLSSIATQYPANRAHAAWFQREFPEYASMVTPILMGEDAFTKYLSERIHATHAQLLDSISPEDLKILFSGANHLRCEAGDRILRQGDPGRDIFIVLDGCVEVRVHGKQGTRVIGTMGKGDVLGEIGFAATRPRTADVIAVTPIELVQLSEPALSEIIRNHPVIASRLLLNLCGVLAEKVARLSGQNEEEARVSA
ncbi:MAG: cyclic nucleotide-binding domain-containing protein [Burkholderiales bacterium]|nr:cyclic nucleotide-binding domain-containing protein [Burkholderiales bacterium]